LNAIFFIAYCLKVAMHIQGLYISLIFANSALKSSYVHKSSNPCDAMSCSKVQITMLSLIAQSLYNQKSVEPAKFGTVHSVSAVSLTTSIFIHHINLFIYFILIITYLFFHCVHNFTYVAT